MVEKRLPNIKRKALGVIGNVLGVQEKTYGPYAEGAHRQTNKKKSCCDADKDKNLWRHMDSSYHTGKSIKTSQGREH